MASAACTGWRYLAPTSLANANAFPNALPSFIQPRHRNFSTLSQRPVQARYAALYVASQRSASGSFMARVEAPRCCRKTKLWRPYRSWKADFRER